MQHHFDITIAKKYGVNVAILLNHIAHWTERNIANQHNFFDGTYWSYNTHQGLMAIFSYWSKQTLRTTIDRCDKEGLLLKGNYNKTQMDRTIWYALSDRGFALFPALEALKNASCENPQINLREPTIQVVEINTAIPDKYTDNKNQIKSSCDVRPKKARSQERKSTTRKAMREENKEKHHWADRAKVCEPITKDPVPCGGCKRTIEWCQCHITGSKRLSGEKISSFAQAALKHLRKKSSQAKDTAPNGKEKEIYGRGSADTEKKYSRCATGTDPDCFDHQAGNTPTSGPML